jgi:transcriptional regulator with XRE-family HTH domain
MDVLSLPRSVPELGRALRRERTRQGLRVAEVAAQTGLPLAILDALEAGTVDRLPDRVQTVKALRGYADALGLPGDSYALLLIDLWPAYGGASPAVMAVQGAPGAPQATGAALAAGAAPAAPAAPASSPTPAPAHRGDHVTDLLTETGTVPTSADGPAIRRIGGTSASDEVPPDGTAQVPAIFADTGVTPAVLPVARRDRPPIMLRAVVVLVALALVVGIAGLVIDRVRPQWFRDIGLTSAPNSHTGHGQGTHHHAQPPVFALASGSTATSATFNIREPSFVVKVVAVGGDAYVTATDPQHASPLFAGIIASGQEQNFVVTRTLTISTGSTSARVFVSAGYKSLGFYFPQAAPYTMIFNRVG